MEAGACSKTGFAVVEGNVYEEGTNVPIHNVYVRLNKNGSIRDISPYSETTTDGTGGFKIRYGRGVKARYTLNIISSEHESAFYQIDDQHTKLTFFLKPYVYFRYRVKNNLSVPITVSAEVKPPWAYSMMAHIPPNKDTTLSKPYRLRINYATPIYWNYQVGTSVFYKTSSVLNSNKFDTLAHLLEVN
jgi:hypothetical protein